MKWFIRILSVFCISLTGAMSLGIQEFEEDRKKSSETLLKICERVEKEIKEEPRSYFGTTKKNLLEKIEETYYNIRVNSQIIRQTNLVEVFEGQELTPGNSANRPLIHFSLLTFIKGQTSKKIKDDIGINLLIFYCRDIYLQESLLNFKKDINVSSPFFADLENSLSAFSIYSKYFGEPTKFLMSHLTLETVEKNERIYSPLDEPYPYKKQILKYRVTFNDSSIYFSLRQKAKNLLSLLKNISYQEFKISDESYQKYLSDLWKISEVNCSELLPSSTGGWITNKNTMHAVDLAHGNTCNYAYPTFLYESDYQLDLCIGMVINCLAPTESFKLNESEQEENQQLLNKMLHQNLYSTSTTKNKPARRSKKNNHTNKSLTNKKKNKAPKNRSKKNPPLRRENMQKSCSLPSETRQEGKCVSSDLPLKSSDTTRVAESDKNKSLRPINASSSLLEIKEGTTEEESDLQNVCPVPQPDVEQEEKEKQAEIEKEEIDLLKKKVKNANSILRRIIKELNENKDKYFSVYNEAMSIQTLLATNSFLVDQFLEPIDKLSTRLWAIQGSKKTDSFRKVPSHATASFRYLMDTPICYLKNVDMRLIEKMCNVLSITVDKACAGSRVKFSSGEYIIGTHVHDKNKGVVDPGFLVDFRNFLRELGWKTQD